MGRAFGNVAPRTIHPTITATAMTAARCRAESCFSRVVIVVASVTCQSLTEAMHLCVGGTVGGRVVEGEPLAAFARHPPSLGAVEVTHLVGIPVGEGGVEARCVAPGPGTPVAGARTGTGEHGLMERLRVEVRACSLDGSEHVQRHLVRQVEVLLCRLGVGLGHL